MRSIELGEKLEMIYLAENGEITQRVIRVCKMNVDTFRAYCFTKRQIRTFKISKILSIMPFRKLFKQGA